MKKVYIVKVGKVTADWGRLTGYETIGVATTMKKAEQMMADFRAEHEVDQFWMTYETEKDENHNRHIQFFVEEMDVD